MDKLQRTNSATELEEARELTVQEKLQILDTARKQLYACQEDLAALKQAKISAGNMGLDYYQQTARAIGLSPEEVKAIVLSGIEKAIEVSKQDEASALKTLEAYLK